jgi:hypothetical protein
MRGNYQVRFCGGRGAAMLFSPTQQQHFAGLGGIRYIGKPKQLTIIIYELVDGEYQPHQFRGADPIESFVLRGLSLQQIKSLPQGGNKAKKYAISALLRIAIHSQLDKQHKLINDVRDRVKSNRVANCKY